MILCLSHAWLRRTLTSKHWHKSVISVWKEDLYYWQRQLFPICNSGFGIWINFDAVLRYSRTTMCGIAVFIPPLRRPPHCLRWHYERVSLTSSNWRKPFFTQFEYMLNRNIDQDLVNRLFITNSLTRFLRARQLCYLLANRTATQRQHQLKIVKFHRLINWKYRANF